MKKLNERQKAGCMETTEKINVISFASLVLILLLILVSSTASVATEQNPPLTINETQITIGESAFSPAIYSNKIVYVDIRNINSDNENSDIYLYDISASTETRITSNESNKWNPDIYGDRLVYQLDHDETWRRPDIYMYNISTHKITQITTSRSAYNPSIYNSRIVWQDNRNGDWDIYMYDFSTRKETRVTTSGSAYNLAIYSDKIVWQHESNKENNSCDIYMYDISSQQETQITTSGSAYNPVIYGNKIVWMDSRNGGDFDLGHLYGNWDIYMYDLSTSEEIQITTDSLVQWRPAIYGDRIVWEDRRNGNSDIYMYDLSVHKEIQITTSGVAEFPVIYDDKIVWANYRNGDLYMSVLSSKYLTADFSMFPITGNIPFGVKFTDKSSTPNVWKWDISDSLFREDGTLQGFFRLSDSFSSWGIFRFKRNPLTELCFH